jgi:2'-5' RNA ligase
MRCFLAIPLPPPILDRLNAIGMSVPVGRIAPRDNLHLTLAFLDEVETARLADLDAALSATHSERFRLCLEGLDVFGDPRPQILHASLQASAALVDLQARVTQAARSAGIDLPRRRYRPHVTLARFNRAPRGAQADRLAAFLQANAMALIGEFEVEAFALYRSDLGHGPARHTELATYGLGRPASLGDGPRHGDP